MKSRIDSIYSKEFTFCKCNSCFDYLDEVRGAELIAGILEELIIEKRSKQTISAQCSFCTDIFPMEVDFLYAGKQKNDRMIPNFRERIVCPKCGLNNRLRATYHLMRELLPDFKERKIYITEEATPFFSKLKEKCETLIGSEYFWGDSRRKIFMEGLNREVNNEDITKLSFNDGEFDLVISCEVLEHIPDYKKALQEIYRVLKEDRMFIFSTPFISNNEKTLIRAESEDGKIKHILPAEYHGDPINPEGGCLCFYHFGWDLLQELKDVGFKKSGAYLYNSPKYGYLGQGILLYAKK